MNEALPKATPALSGEMPPALVFGRGITALGVIRSLGGVGIATYVVGASDPVVRSSRFHRALPATAGVEPSGEALADLLRRLDFEAVLIPCSDDWAGAIGELPHDLKDRFPCSIASSTTMRTLIDKGAFSSALRSLSVPHPFTHVMGREEDFGGIDPARLPGGFWKPRLSHAFLPHFGVKAFRIEDPEEALPLWRTAHAAGFEVVLQEYVPGPPTAHYFIDGFVDRGGSVRGRFARRRLRMDPPDFGNSTYMEAVPLADVSPAVESLDRLLQGLDYRGIFSAEFKRDARDGIFKILEVNSRAWWYVGFATDCGVNVCEMAYRDALGLPVGTVNHYRVGARCAYPHQDYRSWAKAERANRPSLPALVWSWMGASQPIFRWNDPMPVVVSVWQWIRARTGRDRRRCRRPG